MTNERSVQALLHSQVRLQPRRMDLSNSLEMPRASDDMPDLNLDFSNFDLSQFVTSDDKATMATHHLHMHSISAPHSANTSPMLNPVQDHSGGYLTSQVVNNNEVARLQHHLEQQRRLNELNQLQNRILQQQVRFTSTYASPLDQTPLSCS